jgi:hypothetical protein
LHFQILFYSFGFCLASASPLPTLFIRPLPFALLAVALLLDFMSERHIDNRHDDYFKRGFSKPVAIHQSLDQIGKSESRRQVIGEIIACSR